MSLSSGLGFLLKGFHLDWKQFPVYKLKKAENYKDGRGFSEGAEREGRIEPSSGETSMLWETYL